jgi:hypothetical protein
VKSTIVSAALAAGVATVITLGGAYAEQATPVPRLGTGSVTVEGDVKVKGDVRAQQSGAWKVAVDGTVVTAPSSLPFVRVGRSYLVTWADGSVEVALVRETHGSWARVDSGGTGQTQARWINLAAAVSIVERAS